MAYYNSCVISILTGELKDADTARNSICHLISCPL